jgi:uncharacterized protein YndB with AHSA1/START domain/class 3 adenylate cyclase
MQQPEPACLLIADISGYTAFMASVELDHAHDIIADLMEHLVKAFRPGFRVAKFEGDAVFLAAPGGKLDGSKLQDAIEAAYFSFRRRLRTIRQATTCTCEACRQMQSLDVKFVCHHGSVIRHKMAGREELAGRDVIIVHRLLKNGAAALVSERAYALYSQGCVDALGIEPQAQQLIPLVESIDTIGPVQCWVQDLAMAWNAETGRIRHEVARDKAGHLLTFDIAAPRQVVWDHFVQPDLRPKWRAADEVREQQSGGRRGAGTTNHCMHGAVAIIEEVLEWRPFDSITITTLLPAPAAPKILMSYLFTDGDDGGTRVEIRIAKPKPRDQAFVDHAAHHFAGTITAEVDVLRSMIEGLSAVEPGEPSLPATHGRFLPVSTGSS